MGLFSRSERSGVQVPLHPAVAAAIGPAFREDVVGPPLFRKLMGKIGSQQQGLLQSLGPGEGLALIVPCSVHGTYEGLLVLTDQRLLEFKGRVGNAMPLSNVAETKLLSHPGGFQIIEVRGRNYAPLSGGDKYAFAEYQRNHIQVNVQGVEVARYAINFIDRACGITA